MKNYLLISILLALIPSLIFFASFERKEKKTARIAAVVTLCALSFAGRIVFSFIPQVQPVTAIVIIAGILLGPKEGFLTGALSAIFSNMVLGQGPWTPFQMLAWGTIGAASALLAKSEKTKSTVCVCVFSFFSAFFFSFVTDIYTAISLGVQSDLKAAWAVMLSGLAFNISHAVGNVIFILLLYKPIEKRINRLKTKYNL